VYENVLGHDSTAMADPKYQDWLRPRCDLGGDGKSGLIFGQWSVCPWSVGLAVLLRHAGVPSHFRRAHFTREANN